MARVVAVMMCRDEEDIVGHTIRHLLAQGIDHVLVADNLSAYPTAALLDQLTETGRVTVVHDNEPGYYQDRKMTALAERAHAELDADWVLPCDADEFWYWPQGTLAEFFASCDVDVVNGTGWDHIATDDDDTDRNPFARIGHRRVRPQKMHKVAFRWHPGITIDFGNHFIFDHPGTVGTGLLFRHYQYRSYEQMVRKLRQGKEAYDATNLHPMYGTHWREGGALTDTELWVRWRRLCEEPGLILDPAPL